ncbi:DUF4251 domain-containing protein [Maribacter arcticus]|uniref:DUF4251 domain-containing protein n=1 Tax=Maribacter arcticus TaxID=561365 RepID=A0A1T5DSV0_9FLAO|nr:DUF4251 domain-containing protein [Maribacter arcticus]SKB74689.1 protein of unknown function [Maribacter arcticus]
MKTVIASIFVLSVLFGCSSTKNSISDNDPIHTLMASKSFEFTADWANPMVTQSMNAVANSGLIPPGSNVARINLAGNPNYLKVFGDSVSANLPYYGERQFGGGYGSATGIEFNGIPEDYVQTIDSDKGKYHISFNIRDKSDNYHVTMAIFPSKSTSVSVSLSNRNSIRYEGAIKALENSTNQ